MIHNLLFGSQSSFWLTIFFLVHNPLFWFTILFFGSQSSFFSLGARFSAHNPDLMDLGFFFLQTSHSHIKSPLLVLKLAILKY